jgi:hypothetical protein
MTEQQIRFDDGASYERSTGVWSKLAGTDNPMRLTETGAASPASRCGARTRSGAPCKSTPVTGRRRCRMHGGADGSGAPQGARNGNYKHGRYTKEVAATRQWLREATHMLRDLNKRPG